MRIYFPYGASDTDRKFHTVPAGPAQRTTKEVAMTIPNTTNSVTFTFDIRDDLGRQRYSISGLARGTDHFILVERIVKGGYTIGIQASGATGTDITITVDVDFYEG